MPLPVDGWSNKVGTSERGCRCGSWAQHWVNFAKNSWPRRCSVERCSNPAEVGGHVINPAVTGERIVPLCSSCNGRTDKFTLKDGITLSSANVSETCG